MTKVFSKIPLVKSSKKQFYFLICILPDYLSHESSKEFWKKRHFEDMRAGFRRMSLNSLRQNSPEIRHTVKFHRTIIGRLVVNPM